MGAVHGRPPQRHERPTDPLDLIVFFSDAVMAIAITLLAVEIGRPAVTDGDLGTALLDEWPDYRSFALSFLVIGLYWRGHHRVFRYIVRYDDGLVWVNLLFLLFIALLPFPTGVLGEHQGQPAAVVFYATTMVLVGLSMSALWLYASSGRRLIGDELSDRQIHYLRVRSLVTPALFLPSVPLAFVDAALAELLWILPFVVQPLVRRFHPEPVSG
jgi:uncharacterized membrane protein